MQRISSSHSFGESNLHMQFTPKKRRRVFLDPVVRDECRKCFLQTSRELGIVLHAAEFGPDHAHIFFSNWRRYPISELAQRFKGASSRWLRQRVPERISKHTKTKAFWSGGYFYETVGSVTAKAREFYIRRCQAKHWIGIEYPEDPRGKDDQTQLANWFG